MYECIDQTSLIRFREMLLEEERSAGTVEKYLRDTGKLAVFLGESPISKEAVMTWKAHLLERGCAVSTVNSMLAAANRYLKFIGREDCRVRTIRRQHLPFRNRGQELSKEEYRKLVSVAENSGRERLALLLQSICATGIRVSEIHYLTAEAVHTGRVEVALKGKTRVILLPKQLRRKLLRYAKQKKIASGELFLTRSGKPISRKQIWAEMKRLCHKAGISESKVFPHNLRHLFATAFYQATRDIAKLADVLGHSSIETTRIYLTVTAEEHQRQLEKLQLIS